MWAEEQSIEGRGEGGREGAGWGRQNFVVECREQRQQPSSTHVFALATEAVYCVFTSTSGHFSFISYN